MPAFFVSNARTGLHAGMLSMRRFWLLITALLASTAAGAAVFPAPADDSDLIGKTITVEARESDTFVALARRHNVGYRELRLANPDVDPWLPGAGTPVTLPTRYILPDADRRGLVLNIAEMRLYYFPPAGSQYHGKVITYPLGIGREGWDTPLGRTTITRTAADPTWTPPESIREEHAEAGDPLPRVVPPGPDNPLGRHALYLGFPAYLLHGTNKPAGIGLRVSHGCIRLYPEDIAALYSMIEPGTPVNIVNQPYKTGWHAGELYLEAHPPDADGKGRVDSYTPLVQSVINATRNRPDTPIDWELAESTGTRQHGMPAAIGGTRLTASD